MSKRVLYTVIFIYISTDTILVDTIITMAAFGINQLLVPLMTSGYRR